MPKFGSIAAQTLAVNAPAILETITPCNKRPQRVVHENNTPNIILRGIVNNSCCQDAQYNVRFSGNIAVAEGSTVGEIGLALSVDGYTYPLTYAAATPAAVGDLFHVSGDETITVPTGCCRTVTVVNASADAAITVQNLGVVVTRMV